MDTCDFQPRQIVCLEYKAIRLYAEVIQISQSHQVGWVRPLLLAEFPCYSCPSLEPLLYDLRSSADLLWTLASFRLALDTEVMPLLVQLLGLEELVSDRNPIAQQQLNQFVHQLWQAEQQDKDKA